MSELVWLLDRGAALVAYPALYLAMLTGILYNTESFGVLHEAAQRLHIELSVFAMLVTLLHAALGLLDTWFVVTGQASLPAYSLSYFLGGVIVGIGALLLLVLDSSTRDGSPDPGAPESFIPLPTVGSRSGQSMPPRSALT